MSGVEIVPGIRRLTLPLPFVPGDIHVYTVETPAGLLLIDTGYGPDFRPGGPVAEIWITHLHPDHCAAAGALRRATGAPVAMHRADSGLLHRIKSGDARREEFAAALRAEQVPAAQRRRILDGYRKLLSTFPALMPDRFLAHGDSLDTCCGPLQVIHTPGHSPGHVCLYLPRLRILFSGDHVLEKISPHIGWLPGEDTLGDFLGSLERLGVLDVDTILPSHGNPFGDLPGWIARTRRHHERRLARIESMLRAGRRTVPQLIEGLWQRTWTGLNYQLAFTEVLAHRIHLERTRPDLRI